MTSKKSYTFIYEDYLKVVDYFNTYINNNSSTIAKYFNIHLELVDYYLDFYLSLKRNYTGKPITPPKSVFKYKNDKFNVMDRIRTQTKLYIEDLYIGEFNNLRNVQRYLDLHINSNILSSLRYDRYVLFYSSKLRKNIKLIKIN